MEEKTADEITLEQYKAARHKYDELAELVREEEGIEAVVDG
jgi:hypothetical protein